MEHGEDVQLLVMDDSPTSALLRVRARGRAVQLKALAAPDGRRAKSEILARGLLRSRMIPVQHRERYGVQAMVGAAWAHRPKSLPRPVRTHPRCSRASWSAAMPAGVEAAVCVQT